MLLSTDHNNNEKLEELNMLVHPVVEQRFEDWCKKQTAAIVMKEAAILFESDAHLGLDAVICISANDQLRIARVKKRDGCSDEEIRNRNKRNQINLLISDNHSSQMFFNLLRQ